MKEEKRVELVEPTDFPLVDGIGAKLVRVHKNEGGLLDLNSITLCFDNGKSFTLSARVAVSDRGVRPYLKYECGDWEMLEVEKEVESCAAGEEGKQ